MGSTWDPWTWGVQEGECSRKQSWVTTHVLVARKPVRGVGLCTGASPA